MTTPTQDFELAIKTAKANIAPRVTPAQVEGNIVREYYFTAADGVFGARVAAVGPGYLREPPLSLLTFCVLELRNGFTVTGESACVSPENFNAEIGQRVARENAVNKIWPLMGYELRSRLDDAARKDACIRAQEA